VETFDTNIVVRLIVVDDEDQSRQAEAAWRSALADNGVFLPKVVLVENVSDDTGAPDLHNLALTPDSKAIRQGRWIQYRLQ